MAEKETQLQHMLSQLRTRFLVMYAAVEISLDEATSALLKGNVGKAKAVIDGDNLINLKENEIDDLSLSILVRNQPVAHDLRFVVAALRMVGELERIGDEAVSIAERTIALNASGCKIEQDLVLPLIAKAKELFVAAENTFKSLDSAQAIAISRGENIYDTLEMQALHQIMNHETSSSSWLEHGTNPESCKLTQSILVIRSLNRICHRCVNLAEHVYFISEGVNIKHKEIHYKDQ